ncbi:glycosyltransferase family 1 protein [Clostridium tarantellae]|uniref:Glycosyltransferase n=1 Tax=Clostridium tarantellae TaxID=39493 RepID=A0A6I1MFK2_9CLOT|nr:glycosyltransferase family 1 protein [Clostridium tarantellae]MPQ42276.1 glycosyltransferase [Clostridium tarantellae]
MSVSSNLRKKVLHVVGGMNVGGTETMLMNLYREVHKDIQFDFISYYNKKAYYDEEIEALGGKVIRLNAPNKVGAIKAIKDLIRVIKEEGEYEAIHAHTLFNCGIAMIAAWMAGVKVRVSHAHTTLDKKDNFIKKVYTNSMIKVIRIFSTNFLACSHNAGKYLFGESIGKNKKYKRLPNYINYKKIINCNDNNNLRKELGLKRDDILIGHIGRFMDAKNHKFIIEIMSYLVKKNKKIKCVLVGHGHLKKEIETQVKCYELEENILFLGIRNDIPEILNNLDLFLFPSIYEGLGLVLLEAQAARIPCVVSEAIQPEADLGLGLFKMLTLKDGVEKWSETILNSLNCNEKITKEQITKRFEIAGYNIKTITKELMNIYKVSY